MFIFITNFYYQPDLIKKLIINQLNFNLHMRGKKLSP